MLSLGITAVHAAALYELGQYMDRHGIDLEASPKYSAVVGRLHGIAILLALLTGGVATVKERPWLGVIAISLGLFSFLFYNP
jgi:hypothetical protein